MGPLPLDIWLKEAALFIAFNDQVSSSADSHDYDEKRDEQANNAFDGIEIDIWYNRYEWEDENQCTEKNMKNYPYDVEMLHKASREYLDVGK